MRKARMPQKPIRINIKESIMDSFDLGGRVAREGTAKCEHEWIWYGLSPEDRQKLIPNSQGLLGMALSFMWCRKCHKKFEYEQDEKDAKPCLCGKSYYGWTHICP